MKRSVIARRKLRVCSYASLFLCVSAADAQNLGTGGPITLRDAIDNALLQNRQLQIERINQAVAAFTLSGAYGAYDPFLTTRAHLEEANDSGGFDPANFSADAIYSADSEVATFGLTGLLPSGLTYNLGANYAHSYGTRNFLNFDSYKITTGLYLEQPLLRNLWIDPVRWEIQVQKQNLKVSELGVHFIAMSVVNFTQAAYYDLAYSWEQLRIQRSLVETKQAFLGSIREQVRLGAVPALEEKFARSQAAATQTGQIVSSNSVAMASNHLRTLMGVSPENWTQLVLEPSDSVLTVPETFNLSESWRTGLRQRPDLLQLAINVETAEITEKYWKNQILPFLNLFGSYGLRGSDALQGFLGDEVQARSSRAFEQLEDQTAPNSSVGVLLMFPLTSRAERARYRASKELKKQAELILKQKEELILREIADAIDLAHYSYERAQSAREAAQFAVEAVEAEELRQRQGAGSIFLVLQAQTDLANARLTEAAARRDYNKALSQLYFAEGTLLEKIHLDIRFK
jgi:outer membrane protein TolC